MRLRVNHHPPPGLSYRRVVLPEICVAGVYISELIQHSDPSYGQHPWGLYFCYFRTILGVPLSLSLYFCHT